MNPATSIDSLTTPISGSAHGRRVWDHFNGLVGLTSQLSIPRLTQQEQERKTQPSLLDRERSIAPPGYSRLLVPPAALAIHLRNGQVYSFSVFKIPLTRLAGAYQTTLLVMSGLLVVGCIANLLIRPVPQKYWLSSEPEHANSNLELKRSY
jgi:hypothetical protein